MVKICCVNCSQHSAAQDWHVLSREAPWRASVGQRETTPLHRIRLVDTPGLQSPNNVYPDSCHCFHIGWGKDLAASSIVLLAKKRCWPGRSLDKRMESAFGDFMEYANSCRKATSCDGFSKQDFKMNSTLDIAMCSEG